MADDDEKPKEYKRIKPLKDVKPNPMARLGRLGGGPNVKLAGSPTPASSSSANGAAAPSTPPGGSASSIAGSSTPTTSGSSKKVFTPNLAPKARKEEPKDTDNNKTPRERKKYQPRTDRGRGRGRGDGRGGRGGGRGGYQNPNYVQSSSIFEDGIAMLEKRPSSSAPSYGGGGGGGGGCESTREMISLSKARNDPDREKEMLQKILSDESELRPHLQSEVSPVSLPLFVVDKDAETSASASATVKTKVKGKTTSLADALTKVKLDDSKMIFLQLPDSLPFDLPDARGEVKQESEAPSTTTTTSSEESVVERNPAEEEADTDDPFAKTSRKAESNSNATTLRKLPDGQIGRVRVRRSGKCELVFPNGHAFDLSLGTPSGFHQEFVSVRLDQTAKSGEMQSLGVVGHKVIAVPNFETLLKSSVREN